MKTFSEQYFSFLKTALVRVDYNIPVQDGAVSKAGLLRIQASLTTILKLRTAGIRVILLTHFGRSGDSLHEIAAHIDSLLPGVVYGTSWDAYTIRKELAGLHSSEIYMLPNARTHPGEESNDPEFAKMLASLVDVYINDAFSNSHRSHASIVGVPRYIPGYAGYQMAREVEYLSRLLVPDQPCVVVIGGAKFETKQNIISKYTSSGNKVYAVGALAHPIYKAMGYEIGLSKCDDSINVAPMTNNPNIIVPDHVIVVDELGQSCEKSIKDISPGDKIVDASSRWIKSVSNELLQAKTIIWNGPLGWYEGGYSAGTLEVIKVLMQSKAYRVIGGGDTVACIPEYYEKSVADFISTGGGAMLEYLIQGTLPGIDVLQ